MEAHELNPRVVRYWDAARRWWAAGKLLPPTSYAEFAQMIEPPVDERTVQRWRERYPDLLGSWPLKRSERPPWEPARAPAPEDESLFNVVNGEIHKIYRVRLPGVGEDGRPAITVNEYDTLTGRLIHSYVERAIAAMLGGLFLWGMLDNFDGLMDGVQHFCRLAATAPGLG
jgi:hypothetical protein